MYEIVDKDNVVYSVNSYYTAEIVRDSLVMVGRGPVKIIKVGDNSHCNRENSKSFFLEEKLNC